MKLKKRLPALILSLAIAVGLLILPAGAASQVSTFTDITDPTVGMAVEVLRTIGVLDGTGGGLFEPNGKLNRAEFAKMALLVMGKGDEVPVYENRTIFIDVPSSHWARGYINLAAGTEIDGTRLLQGTGKGCFEPERPIPYDEAVTVLLRMLGYGQQVATNWPFSARALATSLKLDASLGSYTGDEPITRGQAAILFLNALTADGTSASTLSLGEPTPGVILASISDGAASLLHSDGAVTAMEPAVNLPASFLVGRRGTAYMDGERLRAFIPDERDLRRELVVQSADASGITGIDGVKYSIPSSTRVLRDGKSYLFGEVCEGLNRPGLRLTVYYTASGAIDFILPVGAGAASGTVYVATADGVGAFDAITNLSRTCTVFKNGARVAQANLRRWDVGIYDESTDTLYVSDFRLTGLYEAVTPNPFVPEKITLMGQEFDVLPSVAEDLADIKAGDIVTALFDPNGKVAALAPRREVDSNALGLVTAGEETGESRVELINSPLAPEGSGRPSLPCDTSGASSSYLGQVVSVSGGSRRNSKGELESVINLTRLSSAPAGVFNVKARTVGDAALADNAAVFERVGKSMPVSISLSDIPVDTIPADQISFVHKNISGKVDILILDDVTGDRYAYGLVTQKNEVTQSGTVFGDISNNVVTVTFGSKSGDDYDRSAELKVVYHLEGEDRFIGIAESLVKTGNMANCAGVSRLTAAENVTQASFDLAAGTFTYGSFTIPISRDVHCYNEAAGTWYASLADALLRSNSFTVYYDRTPGTGAKVRIVVVH